MKRTETFSESLQKARFQKKTEKYLGRNERKKKLEDRIRRFWRYHIKLDHAQDEF